MSTEDHLSKIVAKCRELLALAQKRTQGKWGFSPITENDGKVYDYLQSSTQGIGMINTWPMPNAAYIAACAGAAEAGWLATIAAVEGLQKTCAPFQFPDEDRPDANDAIKNIIAAWPEELLI